MLEPVVGIRARRALLGPGLEPVEDVWMTFDDGVITRIGTGTGPAGLALLDGETALPGLVDCHVHLALDGGSDVEASVAARSQSSARSLAWRNAEAQIRCGVTTVRDLGSPGHLVLDMAARLSEPGSPSPAVVAAGAVSTPRGHGHFLASLAEGPQEYAEQTRRLVQRGARAIKVFATGGVITQGSAPGGVQMDDADLTAVVKVAHAAGVPVAAHAHGAEGIAHAVRAGVDSVEHFSYLDDLRQEEFLEEGDQGGESEELGKPAVPNDDGRPLGRGTRLVSTLVATERFVTSPDRHAARPETLRKIVEHAPHERAALRRAVQWRLAMAAGTDAGTTFNPHGWGMQEQAELLHNAGASPLAVLRYLTVRGARLLREPAGVLQVGMRADLVAVDGDPCRDVTALRAVADVVVRGHRLAAGG